MGSVQQKPAVGLVPREIHDKHRALDILEACARLTKSGEKVPAVWVSELQDLVT